MQQEELIKQFIDNQNKIIENQNNLSKIEVSINDHLEKIEKKIVLSPEEQKRQDEAKKEVDKQNQKQYEDLKALIKSLDNKSNLETVNDNLISLDSHVVSLDKGLSTTLSSGLGKIDFNTQYGNNCTYFCIIAVGLILSLYLLYKFLRIFI